MNDEYILKELQQIKKLLAILCLNDDDQKGKIKKLSFAGFQPKEIAELIGTTINTVSVALSRMKKENKTKRGNLDK